MRICHITTVHSARDARIFYRMCRALAQRGFPVEIIAPDGTAETSSVRPSPWNAVIARAGRIRRITLALRAALAGTADIYHFHDPELIPMGLLLKALRPAKSVVYDVHEDYPSMMREKYWIPKPLRSLVAGSVSLSNALAGRWLDGIVTADPGVKKDFQRIPTTKILVYYNFPVLSHFESGSEKHSEAKADLVYIGGMSRRSGVFVLLDALALLARQGVRPSVKLAGYTDGEAGCFEIESAIRNLGLEKHVELRGRMPYAQVPDWIRGGRIGLVTLQAIPKFMKNIPTKMFEYWACGLPVIASGLPPIRQFLSDGRNGMVFSPSSAEDLARAIRFLMEHPDEAESMGRFGQKQVFEDWNNEQQINSLVRFYGEVSRNAY